MGAGIVEVGVDQDSLRESQKLKTKIKTNFSKLVLFEVISHEKNVLSR